MSVVAVVAAQHPRGGAQLVRRHPQELALGDARLLRLIEELGVAQGDGGHVADEEQHLGVACGEGVVAVPGEHQHRAHPAVDREGQHRGVEHAAHRRLLALGRRPEVEAAADHRHALGDGAPDQRLAVEQHPELVVAGALGGVPAGDAEPAPVVDPEQDPLVGLDRGADPDEQPGEHLGGVERGGEMGDEVDPRAQPLVEILVEPAHLGLGGPALGDVPEDDRGDGVAALGELGDRHLRGEGGAVGAHRRDLVAMPVVAAHALPVAIAREEELLDPVGEEDVDRLSDGFGGGPPEDVLGAAVEEHDVALAIEGDDPVGGEVEHRGEAGLGLEPAQLGALEPAAELAPLELAQPLGLEADLVRLQHEVDEDAHLGAEDLRHHRGEDEVDGAEPVAALEVGLAGAVGGDEDDRGALGALPLADQLGGLEAVHPRHPDVEEDDREVVGEDGTERLPSRLRPHQVLAEGGENRLERGELGGVVVDEQDAGAGGPRGELHQRIRLSTLIAITDTGAHAGGRAAARCPPAWRCSRWLRPRGSARDRRASPWR